MATATAEKPGKVRRMDQKPGSDTKTERTPKAPDEGMRGVYHASEGHGPAQPVSRPQTGEQRVRDFLNLSMDVSADRLWNEVADRFDVMESELNGLRIRE